MRGGVVERVIRPDQHREQVVEAEWSRDVKPIVVFEAYADGMDYRGIISERLVGRG
jgi:hypothetical protein